MARTTGRRTATELTQAATVQTASSGGFSTEAARREMEIPRKHIILRWKDERLQGSDGVGYSEGYPINHEDLGNLRGRLLTLIEASTSDPEQRKATKDVVSQILRAWLNDIERDCGSSPPL